MQPLALRAYERAMELGLKLDSQFQVLNNMGILLTSMGRPADAVETFEKAAALTSAVKTKSAFDEQKALIASSVNVKQALTYSDTTGPAPKIERKPIVLNDVWPQGRVR